MDTMRRYIVTMRMGSIVAACDACGNRIAWHLPPLGQDRVVWAIPPIARGDAKD